MKFLKLRAIDGRDDDLLTAGDLESIVNTELWPNLSRSLRGQRILSLRYDPEVGYVILEIEGGAVWISADSEGCHVLFEQPSTSTPKLPQFVANGDQREPAGS